MPHLRLKTWKTVSLTSVCTFSASFVAAGRNYDPTDQWPKYNIQLPRLTMASLNTMTPYFEIAYHTGILYFALHFRHVSCC